MVPPTMEDRDVPRVLSVAVVGAGLMGHGIAQVFAQAAHRVTLTDIDPAVLSTAAQRIARNLSESGVAPDPVLERLRLVENLDDAVTGADLVVESAPEVVALKQDLFARIAAATPAHAVLASNTSVIPITRLGERLAADARARLVGTHWWNPPHLMPLVEVVRSACTSDEVVSWTTTLLRELGKQPVVVQRDVTGFIGNRLIHALWREAFALIEAGVCDAETIDVVVKNSFGLRLPVLGPMENADLIGLDLTRNLHALLFPELDDAHTSSPLLDRLIAEGHAGMKSGQGLRHWGPGEAEAVRARLVAHLRAVTRE